jgi:pfkB family carbohydrate kinase
MIVVVGLPVYADGPDGEECAGGLAVEVAAAAGRRGGNVELVGKVGNDGAGDAVVVALGRLGIGHAALLRDMARPTPVLTATQREESADSAAAEPAEEPQSTLLPEDPAARPMLEAADVELALRYLPQASVIVLADPSAESTVEAGIQGAAFSAARLIVLVPTGGASPSVPPETTVLEAPQDDDGSFGRLVGTFAGALDAGLDPAAAFSEAVTTSGWEPVAD